MILLYDRITYNLLCLSSFIKYLQTVSSKNLGRSILSSYQRHSSSFFALQDFLLLPGQPPDTMSFTGVEKMYAAEELARRFGR